MDVRCSKCDWDGRWEDAVQKTRYERYGEAFGSPAIRVEFDYTCPVCGAEVEDKWQ
jgi:hypothetical protein